MKDHLKISESVSLPLDAVTQTLACIGRRGAGKTYLATKIAEEMLDAHAQIVVLDPVGPWFGLRVDADGRSKGKDIFVIGGEHGDVPVTPEAGVRIARLLVEKNVSAVLDISGFRQGERKRFSADFAEEFFHLKKRQRSAVHLFIEEAQVFIPQRPGPDEARMLGAFEMIVRLGRNYGIGATIITQRPQSVNKEVLSQVECLCVLQVNGTHERKALDEWVQEAGADRSLVGQLPGLSRGEGYIWSPAWLRIFERVRFSKKTTFDASATPEVGRAARTAMLSAIDVETLKADMREVIAEAEKDDPKALRRRIAELERNQGAKTAEEVKMLKDTLAQLQAEAEVVQSEVEHYRQREQRVREAFSALAAALDAPLPAAAPQKRSVAIPAPRPIRRQTVRPTAPAPDVFLRAGARRMLGVLCQWYPSGRTEAQVAAQVQMKRTGGTWAAYKSDLKNGGYFEVRDGLWFATDAGLALMGGNVPEQPATTAEVVQLWGEKLRKGAREMLDVLVSHRGRALSREQLGNAVGMEASGGTFSAYLSDLKQAGLIVVDRDGVRANRETLML